MELKQKKVLLTGGTAGIGFALAEALLAEGALVFTCGRDGARLDRALARLQGLKGMVCDLSAEGGVHRLVEEATLELGGLDMLINNAGIQLAWQVPAQSLGGAEALLRVDWEVSTNLTAPIQLAFAALPQLLRSEQACLVNVTSVLAQAPKPSAPVYCATKAALRSFTQSMRTSLGAHGVRVIEVVPPLVDTEMARGRGGAKLLSPDVVAKAVVAGLKSDQQEIRVGKARLAGLLARWAPEVLGRMMAQQ